MRGAIPPFLYTSSERGISEAQRKLYIFISLWNIASFD